VNRAPSTAVLDTNLLLLYLAGITDQSLLVSFKRVSTFEPPDIAALTKLLGNFQKLITTPHILAEASNFLTQAPQYRRRELMASLRGFAEAHQETYQTARELVTRDEFTALGLADTGLAALSAEAVVLTTDYRLWGQITSQGGHCVNFYHLRSSQLLSD
jgi:hypothetical protein